MMSPGKVRAGQVADVDFGRRRRATRWDEDISVMEVSPEGPGIGVHYLIWMNFMKGRNCSGWQKLFTLFLKGMRGRANGRGA